MLTELARREKQAGITPEAELDLFMKATGVPKIPEKYNPATWMLEVSSVAAEIRLGIDFAPPGAKDLHFETQYSQSTWGQFKSCIWKMWWSYWRSPDYNLVRYFFTLAAALMVGTIFELHLDHQILTDIPCRTPGRRTIRQYECWKEAKSLQWPPEVFHLWFILPVTTSVSDSPSIISDSMSIALFASLSVYSISNLLVHL